MEMLLFSLLFLTGGENLPYRKDQVWSSDGIEEMEETRE